ncbi:MAG: hypothetical protein ACR2KW_02710 [Rubrobacter sp.]
MEDRDFLLLESAMQAIDEAMAAVVSEVERDRLDETTVSRLSSVEAELRRSRLTLEKVLREQAP